MKTFKEQAVDTVLTDLQESKTSLLDNPFRLGSLMYFEVIREARKQVAEGRYRLTEIDKNIIETDLGEFDVYEGNLVPLDCPLMEEDEPELNKPKSGGPKKYYVHVKDPKTGNVKKVTFGDTTGLKVKFADKNARASFVSRHNCSTATDKTSASYWSCRLPYYAKQLGLSGGGSFYW